MGMSVISLFFGFCHIVFPGFPDRMCERRRRRISTLSVHPPVLSIEISGDGTVRQIQRRKTTLTHGTLLLEERVHRNWQERSGKKLVNTSLELATLA